MVAKVGFLFDQGDQTVFDLEQDFGAFVDGLGERSRGGDGQVDATEKIVLAADD